MSRKITLGTALLLVLLAILITFNVTYLAVNNRFSDKLDEVLSDYDGYAKLNAVKALIDAYYIGEVNEEDLTDALQSGILAGIGDKYARYYDKEAYADFLQEQSAKMVGIGILAEHRADSDSILVARVMPGSPAEKAGLKQGDMIVSVEETLIADITYKEAAKMLKGEEGTTVRISVIRDNNRRMDFTVTRAPVIVYSVWHKMLTDADGKDTGVGYIQITGFDAGTPDQFHAAIAELERAGATCFVFDMRGNPGGELQSVVKTLDPLLPEGPIIRMTDKNGKVTVTESDAQAKNLKVCVLVDKKTASAAELFTAALMDYTDKGAFDATVIGIGTYGKGTVQSILPLSDNTAIAISTATYAPPYSDNYEGKGITPDIYLSLDEAAEEISIYLRDHLIDNQIMHAVEILTETNK